jgi:hypothetical protein
MRRLAKREREREEKEVKGLDERTKRTEGAVWLEGFLGEEIEDLGDGEELECSRSGGSERKRVGWDAEVSGEMTSQIEKIHTIDRTTR